MKGVWYLILIVVTMSCNFETPTQFSEPALQDEFVGMDGETTNLEAILAKHQGERILVDVWASWCSDCIVGMPVLKQIQDEFPSVTYLFLSQDRSVGAWKKGIEKYEIRGEHYFIKRGSNGPFSDFLNSNWIPRYMVIDEDGKITLFKAKKATDKRIKEALK